MTHIMVEVKSYAKCQIGSFHPWLKSKPSRRIPLTMEYLYIHDNRYSPPD